MLNPNDTSLKARSQLLREIISFIGRYQKELKEPVKLSIVNRKFAKRGKEHGGLLKLVNDLEAQGLIFTELSRAGNVFLSIEKGDEPLSLRLVK